MLAIWSLVPLLFLNPAWTSGSSRFTYCWSLAWKILNITLLAYEMSAIVQLFEDSLALPFFGIGMKTELPDVQAGFRKGRRTRDQIANIHWIIKKQQSSRKSFTSALLTMPKVWLCASHKLWKILKEMGISDHLPASWEICMQIKKQQLEPDMQQQAGTK